jgi:hypothetical protein
LPTRLKGATFVVERMLLVQPQTEMSPERERHAQEEAEIREFWRRVMDGVEEPEEPPIGSSTDTP